MKIAIIGAGKMGAWFAEEFAGKHEVAVFDIDPRKTSKLKNIKHLTKVSGLGTFNPDLLLNAVEIQKTIAVFKEATAHLSEDCVLVDITSVKGGLNEYYSGFGFRFASIHPMFGPRFADLKHLAKENAIIIAESDTETKEFFREFFKNLKINIFEYSFDEHDSLMAYSLTLPFASSIAFAACLKDEVVPGTTFARHKEIAKKLFEEDNYLITEVLFNPHSVKQLETICSRFEFLKHVIRARDYEESIKFLDKLRKNLD